MSGAFLADDRDGGDILVWIATEVMGHAQHWVLLALSFSGSAIHLQVHLVDHSQARGADGMSKAFQAAIDLAGHFAVGIIKTVHDVFDSGAF